MPRGHRVFDVVGASAGLVAFGPAMMAIAATILIDDGGPVLSLGLPDTRPPSREALRRDLAGALA